MMIGVIRREEKIELGVRRYCGKRREKKGRREVKDRGHEKRREDGDRS